SRHSHVAILSAILVLPIRTRIVRNLLGSLVMHCENQSRGCQSQLKHDEVQNHIRNDCGYVQVKCPYPQCPYGTKQELLRKNFHQHEQSCLFKLIVCPNLCGEKITPSSLKVRNISRDSCVVYR